MDFAGSMLLPKGIFTNTNTVYDEVAGYSTLPPDKIHEYWHVYTTTNKRLKDPRARRLENFWWHVWGSDRSKLSGRVLAKMFQDISLGPPAVPLRGPPNRWEGPYVPPLKIETITAHLNSITPVRDEIASASTKAQLNKSTTASPSNLCPAQLPPMLKKTGGSSTNIARHTAHFVSLHESAEEDASESDIPSSNSTLANSFDIEERTEPNKLTELGGGDISQERQRPAATPGSALKQIATGEQSSSILAVNASLRKKANCEQLHNGTKHDTWEQESCNIGIIHDSPINEHMTSTTILDPDKILLGKQRMRASLSKAPAQQHIGMPMQGPRRSLFTEATSSTTKLAVQGTIVDQTGSIQHFLPISPLHPVQDDGPSPYGRSSTASILETRMTPTPSSSSAVLPLGRTKSQLTLLLEREKDGSRDRGQCTWND